MRRLFCILAAATFAPAVYAAPADDALDRQRSNDDPALFRGSSAQPPEDVFLVKRDGTSELAGVSVPLLPGLLGGGIEARQQQQCPYPVMCSARSCCPAGYKCCTAGAPPLCCPSTSACRLDKNSCCPNTAVTCGGKFCAEQGSVCCGTSICASGTQCNTNGGSVSCCLPGELKCLGTCCPAGSQCSEQTGYCRRLVLTKTTTQITTTRTSTTRSTQTSTSTRIVESTQTSTRAITVSQSTRATVVSSSSRATETPEAPETPDVPEPSETACSVNGVARRGDQHSPALQRRQNLRPNCVYECHNGQTLPAVEVPNIPGQTDQLFFSMCSGILNTGGGRGGDGRSFDILTYKGADGKALRRSQARCKGYCAAQRAVFNDPASLQCDEYPPAMAGEGGAGAFKVCIPNSQNSGAQGRLFRRFVSDCAPPKGSQFVVRMQGGCNVRNDKRSSGSSPPAPQQQITARAEGGENTFNASSSVLYSWGNMTYMYVPLPALQNGHYRIDMQLASGSEVRGVQVTDSDGEDHYVSGAAVQSGQHVVEFDVGDVDVEEGDELPAGLFLEVDEAVEVSYQANATLKDAAQSDTESKGCRMMGRGFVSWWLLVAAAVVV